MSVLRVGLIQMCSGREPARNLADVSAMIAEAAGQGAAFVATPEMTNVMDEDQARLLAKLRPEAEDETVAAFAALAMRFHIHLLAGSLALREGDKLVNRSLLFSPDGRVHARYDKIHLFDVTLGGAETYCESDRFHGGTRAVVADVGEAKLGLTICYDVRFPALHRALAVAGANVLMVPAAFTKITGQAHWHVLLRARAIETGSFVLAPAQSGLHETGRETYGHTLIVNPWGELLGELADGPGVLMADLDLAQVQAVRGRIPALQNSRDFTF
jgi:deaminated glutathione amidase